MDIMRTLWRAINSISGCGSDHLHDRGVATSAAAAFRPLSEPDSVYNLRRICGWTEQVHCPPWHNPQLTVCPLAMLCSRRGSIRTSA